MGAHDVSYSSFDPAVALADRLRRECRADIVETSAQMQRITIRLTIPPRGLAPMKRLRRDLWMSLVSTHVRDRRAHTARVERRLATQREALGLSRAMTAHNRMLLEHRASA
jgi:hypothetical protein